MEKYHLEEFPDKEFVKLYIKCMKINEKEIMLKNYQKLTNYVLKKLNWKDIDGWKFRSELDK